jgi:hypothetical protein
MIFCSISISLLASLVAGIEDPSVRLVQISRECTPAYLSTGISNLLQPAQAGVVLGHLSTYLASWLTMDVCLRQNRFNRRDSTISIHIFLAFCRRRKAALYC